MTQVEFGDTQITVAGLEHFKGLTRLTDVCLRGSPITDSTSNPSKE